ncbi:MAG: bifunctional phosphopantothenoylcysteine decarboxylase/phosphopantothenate--cysteine ligase CoaBC [Rickettsiales bacterium]
MAQKSVLLIITGSIAAYKSLEIIRRLRERGVLVRCILTKSAEQFVTPLSVAALTENTVYDDLWSLKDETEMGHIRLSREADLVVVAPASADIIAKMAGGLAGDLASATLLASNKPILLAPAMNSMMWNNKATGRNIAQLKADGVQIIEPTSGMLACGEVGQGRMAEVDKIVEIIFSTLHTQHSTLSTLAAIVTAGATIEAIDPVRFLSNRSSGKQGYAVAEALADAGVEVTLISGQTNLPVPAGVSLVKVTSAQEMLEAVEKALPVDIAVFTAAVADFRPQKIAKNKIKKKAGEAAPILQLVENPDILKTISNHKKRPKLVIGFAAETENLEKNAKEKRKNKKCDWILANDVSGGKVFEQDNTEILFVSDKKSESWGEMSKQEVAKKLVDNIAIHPAFAAGDKTTKKGKK